MAFGSSIIARLGLDSRDFRDGLASAQKQLSGLGAQSLGTLFTGAGIKNVLDYADHIQKLSQRYDVNTTSLQHLIQAGSLFDVSSESVAKGLNKLEINASRAEGGNKQLQAAFANLNVTVEDLRSLSPEEILKKIGSSSMNAADLVKVLGKSALELRPTLKAIADGTAQFGSAIDAVDIKKLSEANEELKKLGNEQKVFWASVLATASDGAHTLANDARNTAETTKSAWVAALNAIRHAASGNVGGMLQDWKQLSTAQQQAVKDLFIYRENIAKSGAGIGGGAQLGGRNANENAGPKSNAQLAAEQKERERLQFGLDTLAEQTPDDTERRNNIQATFAGQQAREVQRLEAQARREALLYGAQDPNAGRATLDRADALRQQIGGLKESDKQVGVYKAAFSEALAPAIEKLDEIAANTE